MGQLRLMPRLFLQNRPISKSWEFTRILHEQSRNQSETFASLFVAFQGVWNDSRHLPKCPHIQNHGLYSMPFAQSRPISDPWSKFTRNLHEQSLKQLEIHLQAWGRRFRDFGMISGIYQDPPSSKSLAKKPKLFVKNRPISDP